MRRFAALAALLWAGLASPAAADMSEVERRLSLRDEFEADGLAVIPHRPTYILPYTYMSTLNPGPFAAQTSGRRQQHVEIKYQISFRIPIWRNILHKPVHLYGAYTQLSFWQAYNAQASAPIRETSHEPELIVAFRTRTPLLGFVTRSMLIGLSHQSNGQSANQALSRSWARVYGQLTLTRGRLAVALKPWWRIPEKFDDNPDIQRYTGYGEIQMKYHLGRARYAALWRNNFRSPNRGAVELAFSFPCVNQIRWYVQYWNGYGENLLDYNRASQRVGAGVLLGEWF